MTRWVLSLTAIACLVIFPYALFSGLGWWDQPDSSGPVSAAEPESLPPQELPPGLPTLTSWELLPPERPLVEESYQGLQLEVIHRPPPVVVAGGGPWLRVVDAGQWGLIHRLHRQERVLRETVLAPVATMELQRSHGQMREKLVALTFDDGPEPDVTPRILNLLREHAVPATFFVVGEYAQRHPWLIRRMVETGHELGNHTFSHTATIHSSWEEFWWEIEHTNGILEEITGTRPRWFRPNDMVISASMMRAALELGHEVVLWTIDSLDWKLDGADELVARVTSAPLRRGAVILFHDGGGKREVLLEALPRIIEELRELGYRLVTLSELADHLVT